MRAAWIAYGIASAFYLFSFFAQVEPGLAPGPIALHYHLSNADLGTLTSVFYWIYGPMQIGAGLLMDRYGAKRFILLGSFACAAGTLIVAVSGNAVLAASDVLLPALAPRSPSWVRCGWSITGFRPSASRC